MFMCLSASLPEATLRKRALGVRHNVSYKSNALNSAPPVYYPTSAGAATACDVRPHARSLRPVNVTPACEARARGVVFLQ